MTKEQFLEKVKDILPDLNELILKKAEEISKSGCIDFESFENDYMLPKIFMSAMGEEIKFQYKPFVKENMKIRDNMINFL